MWVAAIRFCVSHEIPEPYTALPRLNNRNAAGRYSFCIVGWGNQSPEEASEKRRWEMKKNRKSRPIDPCGGKLLQEKPYLDFSEWMDAELVKLEARWQHLAAPNAHRISLLSGRMSKNPKPKAK